MYNVKIAQSLNKFQKLTCMHITHIEIVLHSLTCTHIHTTFTQIGETKETLTKIHYYFKLNHI